MISLMRGRERTFAALRDWRVMRSPRAVMSVPREAVSRDAHRAARPAQTKAGIVPRGTPRRTVLAPAQLSAPC